MTDNAAGPVALLAAQQSKTTGDQMALENKKQTVLSKLDELFSDTSVSKQSTLEDLEEIQSEVDSKIEAIKTDIKHEQKH